MSTFGHPDWTPALRGYASGFPQAVTATGLAIGQTTGTWIPGDTLFDVNVVEAQLPHSVMLYVTLLDDLGNQIRSQQVLNALDVDDTVHLPLRNEGKDILVAFINMSGGAVNVPWCVRGFNGIPLAELRQPPTSAYSAVAGLATGVFPVQLQVRTAGAYDRMGWAAYGDRAFDVIARLSFPDGFTVATADLVVGSSLAGEPISGEFPIGAPGLQLGMVNTAAGGLTGRITARAWYDN